MPDPPAISRSEPPICASQTRVASDGTAQLQLITHAQFLSEVGGDFPVIDPFDSERHARCLLGWRSDRIAALGLVAVFGGEAHIHVLTRSMPHPVGQSERDALHL